MEALGVTNFHSKYVSNHLKCLMSQWLELKLLATQEWNEPNNTTIIRFGNVTSPPMASSYQNRLVENYCHLPRFDLGPMETHGKCQPNRHAGLVPKIPDYRSLEAARFSERDIIQVDYYTLHRFHMCWRVNHSAGCVWRLQAGGPLGRRFPIRARWAPTITKGPLPFLLSFPRIQYEPICCLAHRVFTLQHTVYNVPHM